MTEIHMPPTLPQRVAAEGGRQETTTLKGNEQTATEDRHAPPQRVAAIADIHMPPTLPPQRVAAEGGRRETPAPTVDEKMTTKDPPALVAPTQLWAPLPPPTPRTEDLLTRISADIHMPPTLPPQRVAAEGGRRETPTLKGIEQTAMDRYATPQTRDAAIADIHMPPVLPSQRVAAEGGRQEALAPTSDEETLTGDSPVTTAPVLPRALLPLPTPRGWLR